MSSQGGAVNIPTFVAELPPSPRSRKQQNYQEPGAKYATDANNAKLNEGLRAASFNAPIPSMILQESAEEEQSSAGSGVRKRMPVITSNSLSRSTDSAPTPLTAQPAAVTAAALDVKPTLSAPTSVTLPAIPSAMVQVMLQLPGTNYQLPVNIPAETILPALTKVLPNLSPATSTVTTANSGIMTKQVPLKANTGLTTSQPPASQPPFTSSIKVETPRQSEVAEPQTKIPRLSNTNAGTSSEPSRVSHLPPSRASSSGVSDNDADDSSNLQQTNNNRNAASRCRQKKKMQVEKMEQKAKELQLHNKVLENEMHELQHDITKLQSLLHEHRDCFAPSSTVHSVHANLASDSA